MQGIGWKHRGQHPRCPRCEGQQFAPIQRRIHDGFDDGQPCASTLVKTVHEDSKQRTLEKQERREAIARGEAVPEPSPGENRERVLKDAGRAFQKVAGAAVGGTTSQARRLGSSFGNATPGSNTVGEDRARFNWGQAAKMACMAANACAEMQCGQKRR